MSATSLDEQIWFDLGVGAGLFLAVAVVLTGPEDPLGDAEGVRLATRAPRTGDLALDADRAATRGGAASEGIPKAIEGGRPDGQAVFAGHGYESPLFGETRIPEGTTLNFYSEAYGKISESEGLAIETAARLCPRCVSWALGTSPRT